MEKRECVVSVLERIVNNGENFGNKSIHRRADALGNRLDILKNTEARQQTIALTKLSDGLTILQGRDVTIGSIHMWFKRTQTALGSAGIAGVEILRDLKSRLGEFYVEGLLASLYLNPSVVVAASSAELDKWRLAFRKQALRVAAEYRNELDDVDIAQGSRPAWAHYRESSSEQEDPVEVQMQLGKIRDENLSSIMAEAEVDVCQVGGTFTKRKRVAQETALEKGTPKRRKKSGYMDCVEKSDKQMVQAFISSFEDCILAECDLLQRELQSDWQKATGLKAQQDWWTKHASEVGRNMPTDPTSQDISTAEFSEWVLRVCIANSMAHHSTNSEVERLFSQCKLLSD